MHPDPISVSQRSYVDTPLLHNHSFYQVIFQQRGRLRMRIDGAEGVVGAAGWAVVYPGMSHYYWAGTPRNQFIVADVAAAPVAQAAAELGVDLGAQRVYLPLDARPMALAAALQGELVAGALAEGVLAGALASYAAAVLVRALAPQAAAAVAPPARAVALHARAYLEAHGLGPLRVADVAAAVGASESHLQRSFRACFGQSVLAFLQTLRLREAQRLLATSDMPVAAVAAAVGFESQSYFTRLFTRMNGVSPTRWRA